MTATTPLHCNTCGYDLRGLPVGAVCPECGEKLHDAMARLDVGDVAKLTTGVAMLAMASLGAAASPLLAGIAFFVQYTVRPQGESASIWPIWILFAIVLCAAVVSWSIGSWMTAKALLLNWHRTGRIASRIVCCLSACTVIAFILATAGWLWYDPFSPVAPVTGILTLVTLLMLVMLVLDAAHLVSDLARQLLDGQGARDLERGNWRFIVRGLLILCVTFAIGAFVPGPQALLYGFRPQGLAMLFAPPIALLIALRVQAHRRVAVRVMARCAAEYEGRTGTPHWVESTGVASLLLFGSRHRPGGRARQC